MIYSRIFIEKNLTERNSHLQPHSPGAVEPPIEKNGNRGSFKPLGIRLMTRWVICLASLLDKPYAGCSASPKHMLRSQSRMKPNDISSRYSGMDFKKSYDKWKKE